MGAPKATEAGIEITPEMLAAGARVVGGFSVHFETPEECATRAYRAMELVRLGKLSVADDPRILWASRFV